MRSSLTSASLFLSSISLLGVVLLAGCPGGGEACGPGDAPPEGIVAEGPDFRLTYGEFTAGLNNDCPGEGQVPGEGVTSMSIQSKLVGGVGFFTLCIERPDRFNAPAELGIVDGVTVLFAPARLEDLSGEANGCTFDLDGNIQPTGTAAGAGVCNGPGGPGDNEAGFALTLAGTARVERDCGGTIDTVDVTLSGRVAVARE